MTTVQPDRMAWVVAAVSELRISDSWTGRVHIHKLLAAIKLLGLANPPFTFRLYDYGPYSFDLDRDIANAETYGIVEREYPSPGYGPKYKAATDKPFLSLDEKSKSAIQKVARWFGQRSSQDLEKIITCLWAEKQEGLTAEENVVSRVNKLKPKYDKQELREAFQQARELARAVTH